MNTKLQNQPLIKSSLPPSENDLHDTIDLNASYYNKHSQAQYSLAYELLKHQTFNQDAIVLDLGCGDGKITAEIARQVPQGKVIGIDASHNMINFAKKHFPSSEFPNLTFQIGQAEELSFSEPFDVIVSFSCLHWVRKAENTLNAMCNSLKQKGELLILTYPKECLYYELFQETLENYPDYRNLSAYLTMLSLQDYKRILKNNKMTFRKFQCKNRFSDYKNEEELKNFTQGWLTSYVPLPEHLHDAFLDTLAKKSAYRYFNTKTNAIHVPYKTLTIKATKK
jgi:trans-aconitate 2-methyltransferase